MAGRTGIGLRALLRLEALAARRLGANRTPRIIQPFSGYATPKHLVVRGRVHTDVRRAETRYDQGRAANARQMLGNFLTSEVAGAEVRAEGAVARSDEEGYFRLDLPRGSETGWITRDVTLSATGEVFACPVFVPENGTGPLVISDIDDTVMATGAYSLARNLWNSLTGNAKTRQVFPDAAVLLYQLHREGGCPVFYVSSSPWNLYDFLIEVFDRNGVVRGPMFLRDLGLDEGKFIAGAHDRHKSEAIDTILAANPGRSAILMGDTGQADAEIYRSVADRHGDRIRAVFLRTPGPSLDDMDLSHIEALRVRGVVTLHGRTFAGFQEQTDAILRS